MFQQLRVFEVGVINLVYQLLDAFLYMRYVKVAVDLPYLEVMSIE